MSRLRIAAAGLAAAMIALAVAPASAEQLKLESWLDWEQAQDPQISPDGSQIVYTRRRVNKMTDKFDSELWILNADGSKHRMLAEGNSARWSPDGTRIAYVAKGDNDKPQIFVRWMDAEGATTQITHLEIAPSAITWAPDGSRIAFTASIPAEPLWNIKLDMKPEGAKWTDNATIIEDMHYRQDRVGMFKGYQHIFVVPADGGTARQITEGRWNVGKPRSGLGFGGTDLSWTPDSTRIVFNGVTTSNDAPKTVQEHAAYQSESQIQIIDVATGEIRQLTTEPGSWSGGVVMPNGRTIVYGGSVYDENTYNASQIRAIDIDGSNDRVLVAELAGSRSDFKPAANSRGVYFALSAEGSRNVAYASLDGELSQITEGVHQLNLNSVSNNGVAAAVATDPHETGDVVRFNIRNGRDYAELTHVNDDILEGVELGDVEEIWYDSPDGTRVQGWIVKPPGFDPSRKYPMILSIHGGPHGMYGVNFNFRFQEFAANDYVVVYTNPRGSTGYGAEFANAIDDAYPGERDFSDLMAGVDTVVGRGYIDESHMYVTGCSGGGVLTSWTVSHTDRFAAAAALCPVIDWISFAGTADIVAWGYHRFHKSFWDDPTEWLDHSPLMHADDVTTPTLLMTGDLDLRTPLAQAEEFYEALKMNNVPTKLVVMHGEYHGTTSIPSNMIRTQLILRKWFEDHNRSGQMVSMDD